MTKDFSKKERKASVMNANQSIRGNTSIKFYLTFSELFKLLLRSLTGNIHTKHSKDTFASYSNLHLAKLNFCVGSHDNLFL